MTFSTTSRSFSDNRTQNGASTGNDEFLVETITAPIDDDDVDDCDHNGNGNSNNNDRETNEGLPKRTTKTIKKNQFKYFGLLKMICYVLNVLNGATYPILKIILIALAEKLLRESLRQGLDSSTYQQLDDEIYSALRENSVTSFLLFYDLTFYQLLGVTAGIVLTYSILQPSAISMQQNYLNYMEVKRLQELLYNKLMLEPNSVDTAQAQDLVYSKLKIIESYWANHKFIRADDLTAVATCVILFLALAWDLGLLFLGGACSIIIVTALTWHCLSNPWAELREEKVTLANERLLDLVTCRDVVLSHTMEDREKAELLNMIYADEDDVFHLIRAKFACKWINFATFPMVLPSLFVFVYEVDPSFDRVFELLMVVVVFDELLRAYMDFLKRGPPTEEYDRVIESFCNVLRMPKQDLFPPYFTWRNGSKIDSVDGNNKENDKRSPPKDNDDGNDEVLDLEMSAASHKKAERHSSQQRKELALRVQDKVVAASSSDSLSFQNVTLGYTQKDGSTTRVIENFSLSIALGGHYSLMGESGAGKSTILKALLGLIPTVEGSITIDGIPVRATSQFWRKKVAVVSQDSVLFNRSIRENLAYGLTNVEDSEIWSVLARLNLYDRIRSLPEGLDTKIYQNGNEFSGGQKQRLQIARLLLSSKPIILLDEMTSALDARTTQEVVEILRKFCIGKTLLFITHDVQTLSLADKMLELRRGGEVDIVVNARDVQRESQRLSMTLSVKGSRRSILPRSTSESETSGWLDATKIDRSNDITTSGSIASPPMGPFLNDVIENQNETDDDDEARSGDGNNQ